MQFHSYLIILIFISSINIIGSELTTDTATVNYLRNEFYAAIEDEDKAYSLEEFITDKYSDNYSSYTPLVLAYYGGVQTLKAKHAFNPISKLSHLISGLNRLGEAVERSPENLEIRFMRFSILDHVPGIIGYSEERQTDLEIICVLLLQKNYSFLNYQIQRGIAEYMISSDRLNQNQKSELVELIAYFATNEYLFNN